jgi:hypothetical protein
MRSQYIHQHKIVILRCLFFVKSVQYLELTLYGNSMEIRIYYTANDLARHLHAIEIDQTVFSAGEHCLSPVRPKP